MTTISRPIIETFITCDMCGFESKDDNDFHIMNIRWYIMGDDKCAYNILKHLCFECYDEWVTSQFDIEIGLDKKQND